MVSAFRKSAKIVIFSERVLGLTKWAQTSPIDSPDQLRQSAKFEPISSTQVHATKKIRFLAIFLAFVDITKTSCILAGFFDIQ